VIYIKYHKN